MWSLLFTLTTFFCLLFAPLVVEQLLYPPVTARSLLVSLALVMAYTLWLCERSTRQKRESEQNERLRRHAQQLQVIASWERQHRHNQMLKNQRGETENPLNFILLLLAVLCILMFFVAPYCRGAEVNGFEAELRNLTAELQPKVLLTPDELDSIRALSVSVALLMRKMDSPPSGMSGETINGRIKVKRLLEQIQENLIGITVDHAGSILRRLPREVPK